MRKAILQVDSEFIIIKYSVVFYHKIPANIASPALFWVTMRNAVVIRIAAFFGAASKHVQTASYQKDSKKIMLMNGEVTVSTHIVLSCCSIFVTRPFKKLIALTKDWKSSKIRSGVFLKFMNLKS